MGGSDHGDPAPGPGRPGASAGARARPPGCGSASGRCGRRTSPPRGTVGPRPPPGRGPDLVAPCRPDDASRLASALASNYPLPGRMGYGWGRRAHCDPLSTQGSRYNWVVSLCEHCKRARALIKSSKVKDAAVKAEKMIVATCMLCGAIIGPSASAASAEARAPVHAEYAWYAAMWEWAPPSSSRADRGDSEPPHLAEVDQTFPGSAPRTPGRHRQPGSSTDCRSSASCRTTEAQSRRLSSPGPVPRNWAPLTMGRDHTPMLDR
jgi:hypothetical protein